jgi:hypothetical protein
MSSHGLSTTPLASRIRQIARTALKSAIVDAQFADALLLTSSEVADIESCPLAHASWKEAAIGVAQIETELARAARSKEELARWRQEGSLGLHSLALASIAFPVETTANCLGLIFEIDPDDGSFWVVHPDDWSCQAEVRPEDGETMYACLIRLFVRLRAERQMLREADKGAAMKHTEASRQ